MAWHRHRWTAWETFKTIRCTDADFGGTWYQAYQHRLCTVCSKLRMRTVKS